MGGIKIGPNRRVFCIEIGHDGFNPFTSTKYSVWGVWARCKNVSPLIMSSKCNMYPVMLLPPKTDMESCMALIAQDLRRYMPKLDNGEGGESIRVFDVHKGEYIDVHVVLTGIFADGPARDKLTFSMGHNAVMGCYWCAMPGHKSRTMLDNNSIPVKQ